MEEEFVETYCSIVIENAKYIVGWVSVMLSSWKRWVEKATTDSGGVSMSLTDLLEVKLSSNSLTGVLSLEIGDMKVLKILNLSSNQLLGDIPITIGGLIDLTDLSLAVNQLEGSIPESFSALLSLDILDLSYNNLSGRIPKCLEALLYLKYLNVSFNNLRGKIPTGGPFVHFWPTSFISNDAFCGEPRLQVPPCEEDSPHKKKG
ncbi:DNA damage-repair/toleration protein DRT100-like [Carya illinoinensis]|uniref:DNA damage-repair/toleration protein DRT100-like n=1 Tax=Carya illinoinensis TaxID=32201 RepID=UPI001C728E8F|nr:DNA damage-repair/toleration protein DRT100-like [Carya illinoinensis]